MKKQLVTTEPAKVTQLTLSNSERLALRKCIRYYLKDQRNKWQSTRSNLIWPDGQHYTETKVEERLYSILQKKL